MADGYRGLMYAASTDVEAIRTLAAAGVEGHAESIGYHAQQAAEKMLKGAFESRDIDFPFTHNIQLLLVRGQREGLFGEIPEAVTEAALYLSGLISITRYAEAPDFQEGEARRAIESANKVAIFLAENGFDSIIVSVDTAEGEAAAPTS